MAETNRRLLFLYSELAGYTLACLAELAREGHSVTVMHWPVNPEAPFQLADIEGVTFIAHDAKDYKKVRLTIEEQQPDTIVCSGWIDKSYIRALRAYKGTAHRILAMDTPWNASWKQRILTTLAGPLRKRLFTHAWVAGELQRDYARKLGFDEDRIKTGLYSADMELYEAVFQKRKQMSAAVRPKSFLYVGRYVRYKGIHDLWKAFLAAKAQFPSEWQLVCIGTGEDFDDRVQHEDIQHLGFKQPSEMKTLIQNATVFVLPSHFEPWGVVVHEMVQAGLPLLLSNKVGAKEQFLREGENGFSFQPANVQGLTQQLISFMLASDEDFHKMSVKSHELAALNSPKIWAASLCSFH